MPDDFETLTVQTKETEILLHRSGSGPPVLLARFFAAGSRTWLLSQRFIAAAAKLK
jgi:hypothetical protein